MLAVRVARLAGMVDVVELHSTLMHAFFRVHQRAVQLLEFFRVHQRVVQLYDIWS